MLSCRFKLSRIAYVYCTDTILDQDNRHIQEITIHSLERVQNERRTARIEQRTPTPKLPSVKTSPVKSEVRMNTMDKEGD